MSNASIQTWTSAIIAVSTVLGAFGLAFIGQPVPMWVTLLIGAVIGSFFTQAAGQNGARQAGSVAAQTVLDKHKDGTL